MKREEWLVVVYLIFRPSQGLLNSCFLPTACAVKPPTTITRDYSASFTQDSVAASKMFLSKVDSIVVHSSGSYSGHDKIKLPLRGSFGFSLNIKDDLMFGLSYEVRPYASAQYTGPGGAVSNPWLSCSVLHIGGEYQVSPWLTLRGGVSNYHEVYQPVTEGIRGEPVNYPVYSLGCCTNLPRVLILEHYGFLDLKVAPFAPI